MLSTRIITVDDILQIIYRPRFSVTRLTSPLPGTDAEDIPDDKPTMYLNVSRDTHPVLFRRRVLHQFGHALGLYHEFEVPYLLDPAKLYIKN